MIASGVLAGAINPFQVSDRKPSKPLSATVGTSGSFAARFAPDTASGRSAPPVWGSASDRFPK